MLKKSWRRFFIPATLILISSMFAVGIAVWTYAGWTGTDNPTTYNGVTDSEPCEFKEYTGVLTVEEIQFNSLVNTENVIIIYQFEPNNENARPHIKKYQGQIETTTGEINRLNIKPGKQFQTKAQYIVRGFCSPGPNIDKMDKWLIKNKNH